MWTKAKWKKELRDQSAHALFAFLVLSPLLIWGNIACACWAGFWIGSLREITEEGDKVTARKVILAITQSPLDISFYVIGAALCYLVIQAF